MLKATIALAVIAIAAGGADAAVLDQVSDTTEVSIITTINHHYDKAQTFTVGMDGVLQQLDLYLGRSSYYPVDLIIDIRETVAGLPLEDDANTLVSLVLSPGQVPADADWVSLDLGPDAPVVSAGDHLAIVLRAAAAGGDYWWYGDGSDSYGQGQLCHRILDDANPVWEASLFPYDTHFRTWVEVPVATERVSWTRIKSLMAHER